MPNNPRDKTIIITSDEPWNEIWMPQLHYAWQLSRRFRVIFLGPPRPWSFSSLFSFRQNKRTINDSLVVVDYINNLPLSAGKLALYIDDKINEFFLRKMIPGDVNPSSLWMWRFDSRRSMHMFRNKNKARQIYHVIDPVFRTGIDAELTANAELVIVTSPRLVDQYNGVHHNVLQIGQGVDLGFYTKGLPVDASILKKSEGSIILLGTLTDDIDYRFLKRISEKFSDRNLVLIGPDRVTVPARREQLDDLLLKENVYFLGPMPPQAFRKHLENCAVGIIAYDNQWKEANKLRSPLKAIAYLAADKCIISNIECEIPGMIDKGIYVTEDHEHYLMLMEKCFSGKLEFDQAAKNSFFRSIDYDTLLEQIFKNLGEKLPSPNW
jgi:hypothetical protein